MAKVIKTQYMIKIPIYSIQDLNDVIMSNPHIRAVTIIQGERGHMDVMVKVSRIYKLLYGKICKQWVEEILKDNVPIIVKLNITII